MPVSRVLCRFWAAPSSSQRCALRSSALGPRSCNARVLSSPFPWEPLPTFLVRWDFVDRRGSVPRTSERHARRDGLSASTGAGHEADQRTSESASGGTCLVHHCAGTSSRPRSPCRTMVLPGNPRGGRCEGGLQTTRQAAARMSSVVADVPTYIARPRCSCDAGMAVLRHPRRPGLGRNPAG